ncbi:MAG: hypothetical protein RJA13_1710 [Bacteroidota bacterium]|jgi:hypothetical protein
MQQVDGLHHSLKIYTILSIICTSKKIKSVILRYEKIHTHPCPFRIYPT